MAADLAYFKLCRDTDPTYGVEDAIVEYLHGDFDEAKYLTDQICDECNPDGRLLTYDEANDVIEDMTPVDAYWMGRFSCNLDSGSYYRIDGYGHFEPVFDPWGYLKDIIYDSWEDIVGGRYDISADLQSVIDVFDEDDDDVRSESIKRNAPKKKATGKKPAKSQCVKRSGTSGKKPDQKTSQSKNRKPRTTPAKKPVVKKTAPGRR